MVCMQNGSGDDRESVIQSGWVVEGRTPQSAPVEDESVLEPETNARGDDAVVADEGETNGENDQVEPGDSAQMSNLTVVMLGVTGGLLLLYAWVWMSWAQYYSGINEAVAAGSGSLGGVLQQIIFWITPLAPVLWFLAAFTLYRKHARKLSIALVVGLIVTFPLPMVFMSGAAL